MKREFVRFLCFLFCCSNIFVHSINFFGDLTGSGNTQQTQLNEIFKLTLDVIEMHNNNTPFNEDPHILLPKYDFIIVGAGPAGCVLANRLSENENWKVLLIEAGQGENSFHETPILAAYLQGTASNWNYKSVPQKRSCFGMYNNECALPRGKAVGGSSSINYMIYNRGNRRDFDGWAAAGNVGWSYKDVLPYFIKSERANLRGLENSPYHGRMGPLSVEDVPYRSNTVHAFVKASEQAGLKRVDYNGESQLGVSYVQANTLRGRRHSAARAYINPIRNRKNLHILANTRVTKVLIDPTTKTAYGVEFLNRKKSYTIKAGKEVILSAGTFNSPQLLILSGVGPREQLNAIGVPVINDLPVGKIMYDHMSHAGPTFVLNSTGNTFRVNAISFNDVRDFYRGKGRATSIGGVEALAFLKSEKSKEPADVPDVELIFIGGSFASDEGTGLKEGTNLRDDVYNKVFKPLEDPSQDSYSTVVMHFHPKSRGSLYLRDKNPLHWPVIEPNYFANADDEEALLDGIKASIKISKSPAMKILGARLHDIPVPGCENLHFGSDEYWRCSIRTLSCTLHHQVGTCRMGPASDSTAVVSPELKVHGVDRLRVADTSIIPTPPTAHTNANSFMIGEKLADLIKRDWKNL